jgi:ribonuclease D
MTFLKSITKDEVNSLPLGEFKGPTQLITTPQELHEAIMELKDHPIVGFDTETKPTFKKGQFHHVALVQLAHDRKAFLIRLNNLGFHDYLKEFLELEQIVKVGIGLRDDLRALQMLREFKPSNFFDLNTEARTKGIENEGAKNLTAMFLGFRISKAAQVSNWESPRLTDKQIRYAATDAWICHQIYLKWKHLGLTS